MVQVGESYTGLLRKKSSGAEVQRQKSEPPVFPSFEGSLNLEQQSSKKSVQTKPGSSRAVPSPSTVSPQAKTSSSTISVTSAKKTIPARLEKPNKGSGHSANSSSTSSESSNRSPRASVPCPVRNDNACGGGIQGELVPLVPGKLLFTAHRDEEHTRSEIRKRPALFFFSSDLQERYESFNKDFGPIDICVIFHFCSLMRDVSKEQPNSPLVYYCTDEPEMCTNTALLLACHLTLQCGFSPEEACRPFSGLVERGMLLRFADRPQQPSGMQVGLLDCLRALATAVALRWWDPIAFDADDFEWTSLPQNGDFQALLPDVVAFPSPVDPTCTNGSAASGFPPRHYIPHFVKRGVTTVVRLSETMLYDPAEFEAAGIRHVDLPVRDPAAPADSVVQRFIEVCDAAKGPVAVHCRRGSGRAGMLVALWMIRRYQMPAAHATAWLWMCRAGVMVGGSQAFLQQREGRNSDSISQSRPSPSSQPASVRPVVPVLSPASSSSSSAATSVSEGLQGDGNLNGAPRPRRASLKSPAQPPTGIVGASFPGRPAGAGEAAAQYAAVKKMVRKSVSWEDMSEAADEVVDAQGFGRICSDESALAARGRSRSPQETAANDGQLQVQAAGDGSGFKIGRSSSDGSPTRAAQKASRTLSRGRRGSLTR